MLGNICHFSRETCSGPQRGENVDAVCQWHEWRRFGELLIGFFVIIATILCCFSWGSLLDAAGSGRLRCSSGRRGFQEAWPSFSHSPHLWRRSCQKKESLQKLVSTAHGFKIFFGIVTGYQLSEWYCFTLKHETVFVCVARAVLLRSWSRTVKEKKRLISLNLPVEV